MNAGREIALAATARLDAEGSMTAWPAPPPGPAPTTCASMAWGTGASSLTGTVVAAAIEFVTTPH